MSNNCQNLLHNGLLIKALINAATWESYKICKCEDVTLKINAVYNDVCTEFYFKYLMMDYW